MIRKTAHYRGQVQGVGFRWTTEKVARRHEVSGYVRNLADGRVELVAEGERSVVIAFLKAVATQMADHIRDVDIEEGMATGEFQSFGIRH